MANNSSIEHSRNIPELRFAEFSEEWKIKKIEDVFSILNGYAFKSLDSVNKGTLWVKIADVGIQNMKINNLSYLPTNYEEKYSKYLLKKGDYVIALTRPILSGELKIARINHFFNNSLLNQRVGKVKSNENLDYIYYLLQNNRLIKSIENNIAGSDPPNLSPKEINNIKIGLPIKTEQTKIATFLTAVDKRINLLQKKKAELEQYKKGVMQQLFSQTLRFKKDDGSDFGEWEVKKLGEVCEKMQSGGTPKSTKNEYYNGDIPFLSISDMTSQGKYLVSTKKTITQEGIDNSSTWLVPANSLIYSMYASVGFVSINKIPIATSQAVMNMILNEEINIEYLYYYLLSFQDRIYKYIETGTQGNINAQIVKNIKIPYPSKPEQQKIAKFLSSIDESITNCELRIMNMKEWKKGLLQKMFV